MSKEQLYQVVNSLSNDEGVPKQFKILPLGMVKSSKGDFLVDNESFSMIRSSFKERKLDIPIDYEHQTLNNEQAPAAGWIKDLVLKQDGIYGTVEWTAKARDYLEHREYRYSSPVVMVREKDRKAVQLHSIALTNKPAITAMSPIINSDNPTDIDLQAEQTLEFQPKLCKLLGLNEDASEEEILKCISKMVSSNEEMALSINSMAFDAHKAKVESTIELALKEGKLLPYQRDWAYSSAMTDLDSFTIWCKDAPQIVPMGSNTYPKSILQSGVSRSDELLGISYEDNQKYRSKE